MQCGRTPLEVGEEFVLLEDEGRTELSYASVREEEYVAPPVENSILSWHDFFEPFFSSIYPSLLLLLD